MARESFHDGESIDGAKIIPLTSHSDKRGWLCEIFRSDEIDKRLSPAMGYVSVTVPGMGRGPHEHKQQTDMFCVVGPGEMIIVLWDMRPASSTKGCRMIRVVGEDHKCVVIVPPGIVHAYFNIGNDNAYVINLPDKLYGGKFRKEKIDEIRHEDAGTVFFDDFKRIVKEHAA